MFLKLAFLALAATGGALIVGMGSKLEEKKSGSSGNNGSPQTPSAQSSSGESG